MLALLVGVLGWGCAGRRGVRRHILGHRRRAAAVRDAPLQGPRLGWPVVGGGPPPGALGLRQALAGVRRHALPRGVVRGGHTWYARVFFEYPLFLLIYSS